MSRLGTELLPAIHALPKGAIAQLTALVAKAANLTDATSAEADTLVSEAISKVGGHHTMALLELRRLSDSGPRPAAFPNLSTPTIVCQALHRLLDPGSLAQKRTETCGPTAVVIDLCRQRPVEYVRMLRHLATSGETSIHDLKIKPSKTIKQKTAAQLPIAEADWITVASLRDSLTGANMYGFVKMFKEVQDFGIMPAAVFDWLQKSGYGTIALLGQETLADALRSNMRKRLVGQAPGGFAGLPLNGEGIARLAEIGSDNDWSVFLFVDDRVSEALTKGTVDFQSLYTMNDRGTDPALKQGMLTHQANLAQQGRQALSNNDSGGHVMLVAELKIGVYVSLTAFNRGKLVYHHTMPKTPFFGSLRSVVIATDRI